MRSAPLDDGGFDPGERLGGGAEQDAAALVQGFDAETETARRQHQRRVDKPHVPARVAAGELEARREQHAALPVEPVGQRRVGGAIGLHRDLAADADTALGLIADALHGSDLRVRVVARRSAEPSP